VQRVEDVAGSAWQNPGRIEIVDAHEPSTLMGARLQITPDRCNEGTEVQGAGGGRRKAAAVARA
jgi:hypothetical protein